MLSPHLRRGPLGSPQAAVNSCPKASCAALLRCSSSGQALPYHPDLNSGLPCSLSPGTQAADPSPHPQSARAPSRRRAGTAAAAHLRRRLRRPGPPCPNMRRGSPLPLLHTMRGDCGCRPRRGTAALPALGPRLCSHSFWSASRRLHGVQRGQRRCPVWS